MKKLICKCVKCEQSHEYDSFKVAWMKGWEFLKETKNKNQDILGVCQDCPSLTKEEEVNFRESVA